MSSIKQKFSSFYDNVFDSYEKWLFVPVAIFVLCLGVLGASYYNNGEMVEKGIDFTGGSEIQFQIPASVTKSDVQQVFSQDFESVNVRTMSEEGKSKWMLVQTKTTGQEFDDYTGKVEDILEQNNIDLQSDVNIRTVGGAVSSTFLLEAQIATAVAFLVMSTAIFIAFRDFIPSIAVILSAFADITFALAGMSLFGIELTLGSLAALLMLIGYSVDTDIVLSTRVLKEKEESLKERIKESILTGTTMSAGGILAFTILLLVSTSPVLDKIAAVMIMGLVADMPITWLGNAAILKMHDEGRFR